MLFFTTEPVYAPQARSNGPRHGQYGQPAHVLLEQEVRPRYEAHPLQRLLAAKRQISPVATRREACECLVRVDAAARSLRGLVSEESLEALLHEAMSNHLRSCGASSAAPAPRPVRTTRTHAVFEEPVERAEEPWAATADAVGRFVQQHLTNQGLQAARAEAIEREQAQREFVIARQRAIVAAQQAAHQAQAVQANKERARAAAIHQQRVTAQRQAEAARRDAMLQFLERAATQKHAGEQARAQAHAAIRARGQAQAAAAAAAPPAKTASTGATAGPTPRATPTQAAAPSPKTPAPAASSPTPPPKPVEPLDKRVAALGERVTEAVTMFDTDSSSGDVSVPLLRSHEDRLNKLLDALDALEMDAAPDSLRAVRRNSIKRLQAALEKVDDIASSSSGSSGAASDVSDAESVAAVAVATTTTTTADTEAAEPAPATPAAEAVPSAPAALPETVPEASTAAAAAASTSAPADVADAPGSVDPQAEQQTATTTAAAAAPAAPALPREPAAAAPNEAVHDAAQAAPSLATDAATAAAADEMARETAANVGDEEWSLIEASVRKAEELEDYRRTQQ